MVMVLIIIIVTGVLTVPQALCKILYMLNPINCSGNLVKVRLFFFADKETGPERLGDLSNIPSVRVKPELSAFHPVSGLTSTLLAQCGQGFAVWSGQLGTK